MTIRTRIKEWRAKYQAWGDVDVTRKRRHIVRNALVVTIVSIVFVGVVGNALWRLSERQAEIALNLAAERNYRTELDIYEGQVRERENCITAIDTRDTFRLLLFGEADTFDAFIDILNQATGGDAERPEIVALRTLVDQRRAAIDVGLIARRIDDCPPEPTRPELPFGMTTQEALS